MQRSDSVLARYLSNPQRVQVAFADLVSARQQLGQVVVRVDVPPGENITTTTGEFNN
jgi:hypothetical protein